MQTRKQPVHLIANDMDDARHELPIARFASMLNTINYGKLVLVECDDVKDEKVKYVVMAYWKNEEDGSHNYIPCAELITDTMVEGRYAAPDGEGGFLYGDHAKESAE